jgi:hypothetical protein
MCESASRTMLERHSLIMILHGVEMDCKQMSCADDNGWKWLRIATIAFLVLETIKSHTSLQCIGNTQEYWILDFPVTQFPKKHSVSESGILSYAGRPVTKVWHQSLDNPCHCNYCYIFIWDRHLSVLPKKPLCTECRQVWKHFIKYYWTKFTYKESNTTPVESINEYWKQLKYYNFLPFIYWLNNNNTRQNVVRFFEILAYYTVITI